MAPTSCSAGLSDGSSTIVESVSINVGVSMIPLSAMNMSTSNPSMGLVVDLRRASNGQKATKSNVARRPACIERLCGGMDVGALLSCSLFLSVFPSTSTML